MARHPGIQADMRLREVLEKLQYWVGEARSRRYETHNLKRTFEEKYKSANEALDKAELRYEELQSLVRRLQHGSDGIYPWGLPVTITIEEFRRIIPDTQIPLGDKEPEPKSAEELTK